MLVNLAGFGKTVQNAFLNKALGIEGQENEEEANAKLQHIASVPIKGLQRTANLRLLIWSPNWTYRHLKTIFDSSFHGQTKVFYSALAN